MTSVRSSEHIGRFAIGWIAEEGMLLGSHHFGRPDGPRTTSATRSLRTSSRPQRPLTFGRRYRSAPVAEFKSP